MGNATLTYAFAPTRLARAVVIERLRASCTELGIIFGADPLGATWLDPVGEIDFQIRGASELFLETSDTFHPRMSAQSFRRFVELAVRLCERLECERMFLTGGEGEPLRSASLDLMQAVIARVAQLAPRLVRDHIFIVSRIEIPLFTALTEWTIEERGSFAVVSTSS